MMIVSICCVFFSVLGMWSSFNGLCRKVFVFTPRDPSHVFEYFHISPPPHFNTKFISDGVCVNQAGQTHTGFFFSKNRNKSFLFLYFFLVQQTTRQREEGDSINYQTYLLFTTIGLCRVREGPWEKDKKNLFLYFSSSIRYVSMREGLGPPLMGCVK